MSRLLEGLLGFTFSPSFVLRRAILLKKDGIFMKARPIYKEQTFMRVNFCVILYYYVI